MPPSGNRSYPVLVLFTSSLGGERCMLVPGPQQSFVIFSFFPLKFKKGKFCWAHVNAFKEFFFQERKSEVWTFLTVFLLFLLYSAIEKKTRVLNHGMLSLPAGSGRYHISTYYDGPKNFSTVNIKKKDFKCIVIFNMFSWSCWFVRLQPISASEQ